MTTPQKKQVLEHLKGALEELKFQHNDQQCCFEEIDVRAAIKHAERTFDVDIECEMVSRPDEIYPCHVSILSITQRSNLEPELPHIIGEPLDADIVNNHDLDESSA